MVMITGPNSRAGSIGPNSRGAGSGIHYGRLETSRFAPDGARRRY